MTTLIWLLACVIEPQGEPLDTSVAEDSDTDSDTDADTDSDTDADTDTDTDADSDTDADPFGAPYGGWSGAVDGTTGFHVSPERPGDGAGVALDAGDLDGDGQRDLIVGAPYADGTAGDEGRVYVLYGPITADVNLRDVSTVITGRSADNNLGIGVSAVGDLNGDGIGDLAAVGFNNQNSTYRGILGVFLGPITGETSFDANAFELDPIQTSGFGGGSFAALGDVDDDGLDDFAMTTPGYGTQLWYGDAGANFTTSALTNGSEFGAASGDFDGDGRADLAFLGEGDGGLGTLTTCLDGVPVSVDAATCDGSLTGGPNNLGAGTHPLATADVTGDGRADVVVGYESERPASYDVGAVYVFDGATFLGTMTMSDYDTRIVGNSRNSNLGDDVRSAGDADGDGDDELFVTAPNGVSNSDGSIVAWGSAYLLGDLGGVVSIDEVTIARFDTDLQPTGGLATGDLTGDGIGDVVITAPGDPAGGALYLLPGARE